MTGFVKMNPPGRFWNTQTYFVAKIPTQEEGGQSNIYTKFVNFHNIEITGLNFKKIIFYNTLAIYPIFQN